MNAVHGVTSGRLGWLVTILVSLGVATLAKGQDEGASAEEAVETAAEATEDAAEAAEGAAGEVMESAEEVADPAAEAMAEAADAMDEGGDMDPGAEDVTGMEPGPGTKFDYLWTEGGLDGVLIGGARWGDHDAAQYTGDVLLPLLSDETRALLLNFRATYEEIEPGLGAVDDYAAEYNTGLVGRWLIESPGAFPGRIPGEIPSAILGLNAFYDYRETQYGENVAGWGVGGEILTSWVDARINLYSPDDDIVTVSETTTPTGFNRQLLQAMSGYDAEIGGRLPFFTEYLETRVFVGYYNYQSDLVDDFDGATLRLELRPLPGIILDAVVYDDEVLHNTEYFIGLRAVLPFDLGRLARGKNPFAHARDQIIPSGTRPLAARLNESVIRDYRIQVASVVQSFASGTSSSPGSRPSSSVSGSPGQEPAGDVPPPPPPPDDGVKEKINRSGGGDGTNPGGGGNPGGAENPGTGSK